MPFHRNCINEDCGAEMDLRARPARMKDLMLTYRWANDPLTRSMSFTPKQISFEEHSAWFERMVNDETAVFLIIEGKVGCCYSAIAQFRVNAKGEVSISIAEKYRGRRLAIPIIKTALAYLSSHSNFEELIAHIKPQNIKSIRAFARAGFKFCGEKIVKGQKCFEFIYKFDRSLKTQEGL